MVFFASLLQGVRLKMAEKGVLTSFGVRAAPESWSKYTTAGVIFGLRLSKVGFKTTNGFTKVC